ncbi:MAG: AraC family transcriptional regulator [Alicyclobacillus sp.]|nr:AraC family transcriptional regulator [Alicyclobacillus sp.]
MSEPRALSLHNEYLSYLLSQASIHIVSFDIHERTEMGTFNRVRPAYVMSYHKSGTAMLRVGQETHCITPGTVVLIPPNVEHDHYKTTSDPTVFMWCHFTCKISGTVDVLKLFNFPLMFRPIETDRFERVFNEFVAAAKQSGQFPKVLLREAKAMELVYLLLESAVNHPDTSFSFGAESEKFFTVLAELVQHPERRLSLAELAERLHLHPTYISNRFRSLFGMTLREIQRDLRLERAKLLLGSTDLSIAEVAERVGFPASSEFNRMFKRYTGLTPTQYRNLASDERWTPCG